ncbi:sushi, von Willebrand factor type A, EGF and pentraxin domain-containing protein 1-like, partial [Saccoglossus kowalevskii]
KIPPTIVEGTCPDTVHAIDPDNRLVQVSYSQPQFEDDIGIADITCSLPSGAVLAYGVYEAHCIAYDAAGNHVVCGFMVYVLSHDCPDPSPPVHGSKTCGIWQHGVFCNVACNEGYVFTVQPPPYYVCGREGVWDPNQPDDVFTFPGCADLIDAFKEKINILNEQLNNQVCGAVVCDFSNVRVTCGGVSKRRKRTQEAVIDFIFQAGSTEINGQDLGDLIDEAVYGGDLDTDDYQAEYDTFEYHIIIECLPGQVLKDNLCVYCASGEYHDMSSDTCKKCTVGSYQDKQGQTECVACSPDKTTQGTGNALSSMCSAKCAIGEYNNGGKCDACPVGMYQDEIGKFTCKACPTGMSTYQVRSTSSQDCH